MLAARSFSMSSWDIFPLEDSAGAVSAGVSSTGVSGALSSTISGSASPPRVAARSFSISSWDIFPPEDSSAAGSGSAGAVTVLAARSFSMSSWDILPSEGSSCERVEGSTLISGSGAGESSIPAERRSASMSSWDILLFSTLVAGAYDVSGAYVAAGAGSGLADSSAIRLATSTLCWFSMLVTSASGCFAVRAERPGRYSPLG